MSLKPHPIGEIPAETIEVAKAAFPNGHRYIDMRDKLGVCFEDEDFADLYSDTGQPALAPWRLALVTIMQFAEKLSDRATADAVRGRIEWKYALGLALRDTGFHYSVLSEFRDRLIDNNAEGRIFEHLLMCIRDKGLLKIRGAQRTDSTRILANIRNLNRLELVGQTLHHALNTLASIDPDWLREITPDEWFERYSLPFENQRLPELDADREQLAQQIGSDGWTLYAVICQTPDKAYLRFLPAVETLRQVWLYQYWWESDELKWRDPKEQGLPPADQNINSPYDPEARYRYKRSIGSWIGYTVHFTETCDEGQPHIITHVETTSAAVDDLVVLPRIHQQLADKDLLPEKHYVDTGYMDAQTLHDSQADYGVNLVGPVRPDNSWQGRNDGGLDATQFMLHWDTRRAECPVGNLSYPARKSTDVSGRPILQFRFKETDCAICSTRPICTQAKARGLTVLDQPYHDPFYERRRYQKTTAFRQDYNKRRGVEGTMSQSTQALDMRRSRYRSEDKTRLQHLMVATAINVIRVVNWFADVPLSTTRPSRFARLATA
jgi:transposase